MVLVDLVKAFDLVSHKLIDVVLESRSNKFIRYLISSSYHIKTSIANVRDNTGYINIQVGVEQGDPLSLLLFNLAIDPLLYKLEKKGVGLSINGEVITVLAYADDLVLVKNSWGRMKRNLCILKFFLDQTGLKANSSKCHGFLQNAGEEWSSTIVILRPSG